MHNINGIGKCNDIIWGLGVRLMDDAVDNLERFRFQPGKRTLHRQFFVQDRIKDFHNSSVSDEKSLIETNE
jgi:hypothetical protein